MFKYALNYGAMAGSGVFVFFLVFYFTGINPLGNVMWLAAWIPIIFMCRATKNYRDNEMEGFISYGQAWQIGALTGISCALLSALLTYIFCKVFDSTLVESFKTSNLEQLEMMKDEFSGLMGESMYEKAQESFENINVQTVASGEFFNKSFGATLVSLITAAIYKRNKPFTGVSE